MDPIHPIAPGPPAVPRGGTEPVRKLERITRERDRPPQERPPDGRRDDARTRSDRQPDDADAQGQRRESEDPPKHVDVRA
jgi:hypothetical protein